MPRSDEFHELLLADLALLEGHADARQVAAALLQYWDRRERTGGDLGSALGTIAGIPEEAMADLRARVDALVAEVDGDARLALTRRGGIDRALHAAVSREDQEVSRQLTSMGAGIRVPLRRLPAERYLDFMPVGEGGMGIVYWALDTELGRQVAMKVVRPPQEGPGAGVTPPAPMQMRAPEGGTEVAQAFEELEARFLQEAWVTGGMEHPGIVPVYELGRTAGGVPYYTMRFVRGQRTLQTAIDEVRAQPFETRIALLEPFLKICDAIAYAHDRGVVHRDLKPANVALGDFGEAIVLDWGLAKLGGGTDVHTSRWQARVSRFRRDTEMATLASALGTPGYMAPEAAAGAVDAVDERSDVYSLGAILFEILTGRLPFPFRDYEDYAAQVQAEDAPDPRTLDPEVPAGLAALCASALAREATRRPADVAALARGVRTWQGQSARDREIDVLLAQAEGVLADADALDVHAARRHAERAVAACQRVLDLRHGEPRAEALLARARDLGERSVEAQARQAQRAFLRRAGVAALVLVAVVGAFVAWLLEQRRQEAEAARQIARQERDNAARHRTRAEEAMGFMTAELREALEPEGRLEILAQIGERARAHHASIPLEEETATGFDQRTRALDQLGEVYLAQGNLPRARSVFREAVEVSDAFAARERDSALARFARDRAYVNLARVDHAQGYPRRGSERVQQVAARLGETPPEGIPILAWEELRVRALGALTRALQGTAEHARAREQGEAALALVRSLLGRAEAGPAHRRLAIETALVTASARFRDGSPDEALALAQRAGSDARQLLALQPDDLRAQAAALRADHAQGVLLRYTERYARAVEVLQPVVEGLRGLVGLRPENFLWRDQLMRALLLLGDARLGVDAADAGAAGLYEEAFGLAEALHAHDPSHAGWITTLVNLCDRRARTVPADAPDADATRTAFRRRAAGYARKLAELEPTNARWRYFVAFTLGILAPRTSPAERRALAREALEHVRYAVRRIPTAEDVNHFHASTWQLVMDLEEQPERRREIAREGFEAVMEITASAPDAHGAQRGLAKLAAESHDRLVTLGAAGRGQSRRQLERALAFFRSRRDDRSARRSAAHDEDLARWIRDLEARLETLEGD